MKTRRLEPYVVSTVTRIDDLLALVSTSGVVFSREVSGFTRLPQAGDQLYLETLDGLRITGLRDDDGWLFWLSDQDLVEQERAFHATQTTPDREESK